MKNPNILLDNFARNFAAMADVANEVLNRNRLSAVTLGDVRVSRATDNENIIYFASPSCRVSVNLQDVSQPLWVGFGANRAQQMQESDLRDRRVGDLVATVHDVAAGEELKRGPLSEVWGGLRRSCDASLKAIKESSSKSMPAAAQAPYYAQPYVAANVVAAPRPQSNYADPVAAHQQPVVQQAAPQPYAAVGGAMPRQQVVRDEKKEAAISYFEILCQVYSSARKTENLNRMSFVNGAGNEISLALEEKDGRKEIVVTRENPVTKVRTVQASPSYEKLFEDYLLPLGRECQKAELLTMVNMTSLDKRHEVILPQTSQSKGLLCEARKSNPGMAALFGGRLSEEDLRRQVEAVRPTPAPHPVAAFATAQEADRARKDGLVVQYFNCLTTSNSMELMDLWGNKIKLNADTGKLDVYDAKNGRAINPPPLPQDLFEVCLLPLAKSREGDFAMAQKNQLNKLHEGIMSQEHASQHGLNVGRVAVGAAR